MENNPNVKLNAKGLELEQMDSYLDCFNMMMQYYNKKTHQTIYKGEIVNFSETTEIERLICNNNLEIIMYFVDNYSYRRNGFIEYMFLKCCEHKKYKEALTIAQKYKKFVDESLVSFAKLPKILGVDLGFLMAFIASGDNERYAYKLEEYFNELYCDASSNNNEEPLLKQIVSRSRKKEFNNFYNIYKDFINKKLGEKLTFDVNNPYQFNKFIPMIIENGLFEEYYNLLKDNGLVDKYINEEFFEYHLGKNHNKAAVAILKFLKEVPRNEFYKYSKTIRLVKETISVEGHISYNNMLTFNAVDMLSVFYCLPSVRYIAVFKKMIDNQKIFKEENVDNIGYLGRFQDNFIPAVRRVDIYKAIQNDTKTV